jgi:hypothetical protein
VVLATSLRAQEIQMSQVSPFSNAENVRSAVVTDAQGDNAYPIFEMGQTAPLFFQFDLIQEDREWLKYTLVHADWEGKLCSVDRSEYIRGFVEQEIQDMEFGYNTTTNYIHYQIPFPNDFMAPTQSGRYWLLIFKNDDWEDPANQVMAYPLFVVQPQMNLMAKIEMAAGEHIYSHVKLRVEAYPNHNNFADIPRDIRIQAFQNLDLSNSKKALVPAVTFIQPNLWTFSDPNSAGFPAGNEWRMLDTRQIISPGLHIDHTLPNQDLPQVFVQVDESNAKGHYSWDDLNGRCQFGTTMKESKGLNADYLMTHFEYRSNPFPESTLVLELCTAPGIKEMIPCSYDNEKRAYTVAVALKQGVINYRYRMIGNFPIEDELRFTEGNFTLTRNDYHLFLYQSDPLYQMDKIIGFYFFNEK